MTSGGVSLPIPEPQVGCNRLLWGHSRCPELTGDGWHRFPGPASMICMQAITPQPSRIMQPPESDGLASIGPGTRPSCNPPL